MEKTVKQIRQYVKECFKLYSLRIGDFFYEYDEQDMPVEATLFKRGVIDDGTLSSLERILGIRKSSILATDESAQKKWYKKYIFFYHRPIFEATYYRTMFGDDYEANNILKAIFGEKFDAKPTYRYDYKAITGRLISTLKEIDTVLPGTFHENADITELEISSNQFCSYPDCVKMLASFIDMFNTAKHLYYKARKEDLSEDEVLEYNFLVTTLGIKDVICPSVLMYYDVIKSLRTILDAEGFDDFFSYVKFSNNRIFDPWRCREFVTNKDYVQAYVNIYPQTKREMFDYAMKVAKFECFFRWSDAKPIVFADEDDDFMGDIIPDVPLSERAKEPTTVYVNKTPEELSDDGTYAELLIRLTGCESDGGVITPRRLVPTDIERMTLRVEALKGGKKND